MLNNVIPAQAGIHAELTVQQLAKEPHQRRLCMGPGLRRDDGSPSSN
jgi:hypothetical protein